VMNMMSILMRPLLAAGQVCLLLAALITTVNANTINLDFENGINLGLGHGPVPVQLYNIDGLQISFSDASYSPTGSLSNATIGSVFILPYVSTTSGAGPFRPITVDFNFTATNVSILVIPGLNHITNTLTAYGATNGLIAHDSYVGSEWGLLSVSGQNIRRIVLDGQLWIDNNNGFVSAFDNLSVTVSSTPLPAALPLFASGLGALGLLGWCRKRKAQAAA
jgi:hypothetical protein